jgi:hypothetical protein
VFWSAEFSYSLTYDFYSFLAEARSPALLVLEHDAFYDFHPKKTIFLHLLSLD